MNNLTSFLFGTVGSPKSTPKTPGGSIGAVQRIHELGLNALELGWVRSVRVSKNTCNKINIAAQKHHVKISVHAPYFINLNASKEEWPKARKRLMDAAYFGFLAGATDIVFHPGSYFGKSSEEVLEKAAVRLSSCATELKQKDIQVILRPETMGKASLLGSIQDVLFLSSNIEGVQPCLDLAHLHARPGDGSMNTVEEWSYLLDSYAQSLGVNSLHHLHIHLSGIQYSAKGERKHLPLRESDLDIESIFQALHKFKCKGRIVCESPILENDALYLQKLWCKTKDQ